MTKLFLPASVLALTASLALGAGLPGGITGDYVEARTADVFVGPCFANSEVGLTGELAVFGWKVRNGSWAGVNLTGLSVVGVVRAKSTLGDVFHSSYPVKAVMIVDEKATPEQRLALQQFARKAGGDLFQDVVRVDYRPIDLNFENDNVHSMKAILKAGDMARIQTRAIFEGDHVCKGNEDVFYRPLTKLDHAMAAFTIAHQFKGEGLGATWSNPDKRSAFIGTFTVDND